MSKASKLHTQCLYEDYSYGSSVGTACATSAAATGLLGVSNDVVIVKVDDDNNDRFKEYEALAESIEDEADIQKYQSNTQRAIPYYVCEQYCSNDPKCYGFVPDYEFGQKVSTTTFSFSNNNDGIVEYDKIRCIIARNASPDTAIMNSINGLTIPAPCYTKLMDQCIQPNEATIERSAEVCDACHDLTDNCFWCEPHKANFFVASTAQPGKCVCEGEASYLYSSTQSSSMGESVFERQAKICKMLLPHNDGYPIDLTNGNNANGQDSNGPTYPSSSSSSSMQMSYYNETTTNVTSIINTQARSCQAAIEQFRGGSASTNGSNGTQTIAGVTVSSVIVVAVVVSILIPCCICCCLVYLCCFRNKGSHGHGHGRPPTYGSGGGGNAGGHHPSAAPVRPPVSSARPTTNSTSVPYGNGGGGAAGRPQGHQTTTTTTNNNINNNTNTNTNTNNNPSTTTTTNHHHYYYNNSQTPVEAIPVDVISTGVAASSTSPYNPYYYNSVNGNGGDDLEDGTMIKPMTYSFSNIEPLPPPSASYEIPTPSATNPNYDNNYNSNNDDDDENEKDTGAIMVRVVAPCDMDEGFRFGASYQGQQFEIVAPKGGLRAGQEMIVSVPQRRTGGGRQRDTTTNGGGGGTSNNNNDDDDNDEDMLPVARPVVD